MKISWTGDIDAALERAKEERKNLLVEFSAAPMCAGCARLDAEVYSDEHVAAFIRHSFIPVKISVQDDHAEFERFAVQWTPTMLIVDIKGKERYRFEGYLPPDDFLVQLDVGIAKTAFAQGDFGAAESHFRNIVEHFPLSDTAPEALYWAGVSRYKATQDVTALRDTAVAFRSHYDTSSWAKKSSVWLPA